MDSYQDWLMDNIDSLTKLKNCLYKKYISGDIILDSAQTTIEYSTITMDKFLDSRKPKITIKIKKSDIHGNGVFATKNIKKNSFITFYPCHFVQIDNHILGTEHVKDSEKLCRYTLASGYDDRIKWIGDPDKFDDISRIGHIINHGKSENSNAIYQRHRPDNIWFIKSTKDIKKGEEILVNYGNQYWKSILN
jgi:SET domain-containing protein